MNNLIYIDVKHQVFWLSYEYLRIHNIPEDSFMNWSKRDVCKRKYIERRAYINYDTIPAPSRAKLPSKDEIKQEHKRLKTVEAENRDFNYLQEAYKGIRAGYWRNQILALHPGLESNPYKLLEFARRAAVFEEAVHIHSCTFRKSDSNTALFHAFNRIFPEKGYKYMSGFCRAIDKAKREGVLSVAVDERTLRDFEPKYKEDYQAIALSYLSDEHAFDIVDCYAMFVERCKDLQYKDVPCWKWFQLFWLKNRNIIEPKRNGKTEYDRKNGNYAKIIPALHVGDQWQMDGWTLPFWCKRPNEKGGTEYYFRYILFAVMDAHSRKIIGFTVGESENTETIINGLEAAVRETGTIPYELVADRHSFNKTKEAGNLKEITEKWGMTWTTDSNPRRKAILERAFRTLGDKHFKFKYGYLGQGIKSKIPNGITQQELKDEYAKSENQLTYEQVLKLTASVIFEYNDTIKKGLKESPNERFAKSEQPNSIRIDDSKYMEMFTRTSEHKVLNGQIVIKRGMHAYEYQLPAEHSVNYNGKIVGVRYSDFDNIYLYDIETGQYICGVSQKSEIHGALANQTEPDIKNLQKTSGRVKGIDNKKRKKTDSIYDKGNTINPDIIEGANVLKMPKDVAKQARQDKDVNAFLIYNGIKTEIIPELPVLKIDGYKKKEEKSPFYGDSEIYKETLEKIGESRNLSPII